MKGKIHTQSIQHDAAELSLSTAHEHTTAYTSRLTGLLLSPTFILVSSTILTSPLSYPQRRIYNIILTSPEVSKLHPNKPVVRGIRETVKLIRTGSGFSGFWHGCFADTLARVVKTFSTITLGNYLCKKITLSIIGHNYVDLAENTIRSIIGTFISYPLQYTAMRLSADVKYNGEYQFRGIVDVWRKTVHKDGFVGLYRGLSAALAGKLSYGMAMQVAARFFPKIAAAGLQPPFLFASAIFEMLILLPFHVVTSRMMMRSCEDVKYPSFIAAIKSIATEEGILALFGGSRILVYELINAVLGTASLLCLPFFVKMVKNELAR